MTAPAFHVGLVLFPGLTQLDLTGPYEIFARLPGAVVHLVAKSVEPVRTEHGLILVPTTTFDACPKLDLLCMTGGPGMNDLLNDEPTLDFLRRAAAQARFVTAVCTGSLVLGAAGLLRGRRATAHWMSVDFLRALGAEPVAARVVVDGNLITGGGVTAGIDFALAVAAQVAGRDVAEQIQLSIEYDPEPPFRAGSPARARPEVVADARAKAAERQRVRGEQVARAARRLGIAS